MTLKVSRRKKAARSLGDYIEMLPEIFRILAVRRGPSVKRMFRKIKKNTGHLNPGRSRRLFGTIKKSGNGRGKKNVTKEGGRATLEIDGD